MNEPFKLNWTQGINSISSTQKEILGAYRLTADGRGFRYAKAGSSALAAGKMGIATAAVANHVNIAVAAAAAIGDTEVTVTLGATAATADYYKDGYLQVNDATGEGHQYRVDTHAGADASASLVVKLADPIRVALVAGTSEVSLIASPWYGVTESATEENVAVGVPTVAVTAAYYYWAQTKGPACVLSGDTAAVGTMLTMGSTAGELVAINTTLDIDQPIIAKTLGTAGADTEYKPVLLMID